MKARTKILLPLMIAFLCLLVATSGYMMLEGWTLPEALYMAVIVLSTTGLKEIHEMDRWGLAWTVVVIVFGAASLAAAYSLMTSAIVGGELRRVMGRRMQQNKINQLDQHVIVCGYGRMGEMITEDLIRQGVKVVVIDNDDAQTARLEERSILYALGDASDEQTLLQAGVMRARGLVAVLPQDSSNVFVTLTARGFRDDLSIVARAEQTSTEPKLRRAGANHVICPTVIGASRVTNLIIRPHVADFIEVTAKGVELELDEYRITSGSLIKEMTLRHSELRQKANVIVVAVRNQAGQMTFNPGPEQIMQVGDTLILIGPAGLAGRLQQLEA